MPPPVPAFAPANLSVATQHRHISSLFTFLYRHWRRFASWALLESPWFTTPNAYDYLATLYVRGSLSHLELIAGHRHSQRTGRKTSQRLLAGELVVKHRGPDTRCHLLALTSDGHQLLTRLIGPVAQASLRLLGDLTPLERYHLHHPLGKLEAHH